MKQIKANYKKVKEKHPLLSNYCSLAITVKDKKFSRFTILQNFNKLVDKSEYEAKDKTKLIDYLYKLSNPSVEQRLEGKNASDEENLYEDDTSY
jgi:hypothetical protein